MTAFRSRKYHQFGAKTAQAQKKAKDDRKNYNYQWEKASKAYRIKHPFCRFCEQEGFETSAADDVDHIIPISDGGSKFDWDNLQSLCKKHHYGKKERLQLYARKHGLMDQLPLWCADPGARPDLTKRR